MAIAAAHHALIAATDAGVRLERDWLEQLLIVPCRAEDPADVVSGAFVAAPETLFELALGAVTLPAIDEIDPATFNPSSRSVAFRREAWQKVGGYPEWLDYCEDLLFDLALRDATDVALTLLLAPWLTLGRVPRSRRSTNNIIATLGVTAKRTFGAIAILFAMALIW